MNTKSNACERCGRCREGRFDLCKNETRLADAGKAALPFVAFAYAHGVDGAEAAGRELEGAIGSVDPNFNHEGV